MRHGQQSGPPSWFVILLGIAIVFGLYYLWLGLRNFMSTGVTVVESTQQAIVEHTATAVRRQELAFDAPTPLPSFTPIPPCQEFAVIVREAIVRSAPTTSSQIVAALKQGEKVCVIAKMPDSEWYILDENPLTRRLDRVYMHQDIIRALYPTATPTITPTPSPTATPTQPIVRQTRPANPPATETRASRFSTGQAPATASTEPPSIQL